MIQKGNSYLIEALQEGMGRCLQNKHFSRLSLVHELDSQVVFC
jgi:hypothetical protein